MSLKLYNTLTRRKEELPGPDVQKKIRLFVCGPTVYDYAHIGHARTYIFFDFFAKYLRSEGYEVTYLQNITDIDDKIIKRAIESGKDPLQLAKEFTKAYLEDMKALGVDGEIIYAPATDFIMQIVGQVERLREKGIAYKIDGDGWYFEISKDPDYGKLSGRTAEQAEDAVSRIDDAIGKRSKGDFCLWKFSKEGEPSWNVSLGTGRPGWHIEDTAISEYYFGPQYDIHGGGVDLKFPHHEAEIAQQESASGLKPFVKIWMHTGALLVDGKKMSKSLGNFITIREFLMNHSPEVLRWITLTHHYRSPIDYSNEATRQAEQTIANIKEFYGQLDFVIKNDSTKLPSIDDHKLATNQAVLEKTLADDMNISEAMACIFEIINEIRPHIWKQLTAVSAQKLKIYIQQKMELFGFSFGNETPIIPVEIERKIAEREQLRKSKEYTQSDNLRKEIEALGYTMDDTPLGPFVWPRTKDLDTKTENEIN